MNESNQEERTLSIFVHDSVFVSDQVIAEIVIVLITAISDLSFNASEINQLRELLRASIGSHAESLADGDITEFATAMLEVTAVVLKAKHAQRKVPFNKG